MATKENLLEKMALETFFILTGKTSLQGAKDYLIFADCVKSAVRNLKIITDNINDIAEVYYADCLRCSITLKDEFKNQ